MVAQPTNLQRISTGLSLVSLALGFWVFAMLIIINRHQAELNGLSGGSSFAIVGGIGAFLVGTVFLVAACLHWRFCVRHPAALPVRRQRHHLGVGLQQMPEPGQCAFASVGHKLIVSVILGSFSRR